MTDAPNRIRELRMQARLSQEALGQAIGVSKVTISDLERGHMQLTLDYMQRIAAALGVPPSDLLPITANPDALSLQERQLIQRLREATLEQRDQVHRVADVIAPWRGPVDEPDRLLPRNAA